VAQTHRAGNLLRSGDTKATPQKNMKKKENREGQHDTIIESD